MLNHPCKCVSMDGWGVTHPPLEMFFQPAKKNTDLNLNYSNMFSNIFKIWISKILFYQASLRLNVMLPTDMVGVLRELIEHALKVNTKATSKKQHLWWFAQDKSEAIKKELAKLLATGLIKKVYHPKWLANSVLMKKKNNHERRMCIDYTHTSISIARGVPLGYLR